MDITAAQPTLQVGGNGMGGDWGIMFLAFLAMMDIQATGLKMRSK